MKRPWFPLYASDWLNDAKVKLLSLDAQAIYMRLLCIQWIEGALPDDDVMLARLVGVHQRTFDRHWKRLCGFFEPFNSSLIANKRLLNERLNADEKSQKSAKAANIRHHVDADAMPRARVSQSQSQSQSTKTLSSAKADSFDFDAVWNLYPRKLGKRKGFQRCRSQVTTREKYDALVKAVKNYTNAQADSEAKYVKHFDTFMACWEDWVDPPPTETKRNGHEKQQALGWAAPSEPFTESRDATGDLRD